MPDLGIGAGVQMAAVDLGYSGRTQLVAGNPRPAGSLSGHTPTLSLGSAEATW